VVVKRMPEPLTVPKASYPSDAKRKRVEGTVRLLVTVDQAGRVVSVRVLSGLGHGLDEAAETALRQARFRPAIGSDDRPLQYSIRYRYTFRLEG
jgi:protein TonB